MILVDHFRTAGAVIQGPFATLEAAECNAMSADVAVLDILLHGRPVFGLADRLRCAGIPFLFYTGHDLSLIPARFHDTPRLSKPATPSDAAWLTWTTLASRAEATLDSVVPRLRLSARLMIDDPMAADRLVEATLLLALQDRVMPNEVDSLGGWLHRLMARALKERALHLLN